MRRRCNFQGRVQGVGFRATARSIAGRYPITGWVRNEDDGSVMLEAQGAPTDVEAYLAELRRMMNWGISGVTDQEVADVPGQGGFVIRH